MLVIKISEMYTTIDVVPKKKVTKSYTLTTPVSTVQNGDIVLRDKISALITDFIITENLTQHTEVFFLIDSNKIFSKIEQLPNLSNAKIDTAVKYNAPKWFPVDLSDYTVIHTAGKPVNKKRNIHISAVPNSIIACYKNIAERISLELVGIECITDIQIKALGSKDGLFLNVDADALHFMLLEKGNLSYLKTVPIGMNTILSPLAESIPHKTHDEVLEMVSKNSTDIIMHSDPIDDSLSYIARQIDATIQLINTQKHTEFKEITLIGEYSQTILATQMLKEKLESKLNTLNLDYVFDRKTKLLGNVKALKTEVKADIPIYIPVTICTVLILVAIGQVVYSLITVSKLENEVKSILQEIEALNYVQDVEALYYETTSSYANLEKIWAFTENQNEELNELITFLENQIPKTAEITAFSSSSDSVSLSFNAKTYEDTIVTIAMLKKFENISNVEFSSVTKSDENNVSVTTYAIQCIYKPYEVLNEYNTGGISHKLDPYADVEIDGWEEF